MKLTTQEELQSLGEGLRKRKLPRVFDGMWCSELGIGGMKLSGAESDFHVEWVSFDGGVKSELKRAMWSSLCSDPSLETQRLEIGLIVSAIFEAQGQKIMDSIGHPIEAYNASGPYRDAAAEWKHWALVKAGHMLGL